VLVIRECDWDVRRPPPEGDGCGCRRDGLRVERVTAARHGDSAMTRIITAAERDAFGPSPVSAGYKVDISRGERILLSLALP
jgi:hypothetical protein